MDCLDENAILELLEGGSDEARSAELLAHVDACADCRRLLSRAARAGEGAAPEVPARPASVELETLIGRRLGNFEVTAFLGAGAMGSVFAGRHVILGHAVAIKVMQADYAEPAVQAQATERFITEARALTEIHDPHVIQLHDFGQLEAGSFYYVMERLEGRTLEQELRARGRLSPEQVLPYLERRAGSGATTCCARPAPRSSSPRCSGAAASSRRTWSTGASRPPGTRAPVTSRVPGSVSGSRPPRGSRRSCSPPASPRATARRICS
jgi:hypothetical protein